MARMSPKARAQSRSDSIEQYKMKKVMHEYKHGELHSGSKSGPLVKSRKQAIAIGMSEARAHGAKIPRKRGKK